MQAGVDAKAEATHRT